MVKLIIERFVVYWNFNQYPYKCMNTPALAYFDHNVLSDLTDLPKGSTDHFFGVLNDKKIVPVYSDENLHEVSGSIKRVDRLLDLFTDYGFQHLYEEMVDFKSTDQIQLADKHSRERYEELQESSEEFPDDPTSLDFVRKMFGGPVDASSFEILLEGIDKVETQLKEATEGAMSLLTTVQLNELEESLAKLLEARRLLETQKADLLKLDSADNSAVREIRQYCGVGSGELNTIQGERVLERIWEKIGSHLGAPERTLADFFDSNINDFASGYRFSNSIPTRVSSIYQQLNLIGYCKDDKMHRERRFNAAQSDGKHVGMAAMCQLFFCNDKMCKLKAHAAFQYVGSGCVTLEAKLHKEAA